MQRKEKEIMRLYGLSKPCDDAKMAKADAGCHGICRHRHSDRRRDQKMTRLIFVSLLSCFFFGLGQPCRGC